MSDILDSAVGCDCGVRSYHPKAVKPTCHRKSRRCQCNWQRPNIKSTLSWLRTKSTYWTCICVFFLLVVECSGLPKEAKVCGDIHIRNSLEKFKELTNCTVIEGSLKILLIERTKPEEFDKLSFPDLVEITDYFLIYRVYNLRSFKTIFPNLSVIRGVELFFDYALVAFEVPDLEELGLPSLTYIARGAVRLEKNPLLCYIKTINWKLITETREEDNFIIANKAEDECVDLCPQGDQCPQVATIQGKRQPACWSYDKCQKVCECPIKGRACIVGTNQCCHEQCVGGCTGPTDEDCIACKNYYSQGRCLQQCEPHTYEFHGWRCILGQECKKKVIMNMPPEFGIPFKKQRYRMINNKCTPECPHGYMEDPENEYKCIKCDGPCPKVCDFDATIDSVSSAQKLEGCSIITGTLMIFIQGGEHVSKSLEQYLGSIREVHSYVSVLRSNFLVSLNFLKNLRLIKGKNLHTDKYAFVILGNHYLQEIWDTSQHPNLTIERGSFYIHQNPHLCFSKIQEVLDTTKYDNVNDGISDLTNGDKLTCKHDTIKVEIYSIRDKFVFINFSLLKLGDPRQLLGYAVHYKEAPTKNLTILHSKAACDNEGWLTLEVRVDMQSEPDANGTTPSKSATYIPSLKPWTQYGMYVETVMLKQSTEGGRSKLIYFRTKPSRPTPPHDIKVTATKPNQLVIQWKPPRSPNGNVTHYYVYWQAKQIRRQVFDMRDYCTYQLTFIDKKKEEVEQDTKNFTDPNCCACPKSEKEVRREEAERAFQIKFENFLHNTVYIKRPTGHPDAVKKQGESRARRSLGLDSLPANNSFLVDDPGEVNATSVDNTTEPVKNESQPDERDLIPYLASVVFYKTHIVLNDLHHFQEYSIEVIACQDTPAQDGSTRLCSNRAILTGRTLSSDTADRIPEENVTVSVKDDYHFISWMEPPQPNGLIVTYHIDIQPVNKISDEEQGSVFCLTHTKFKENKMGYAIPKGAIPRPGNYTFKLRATSLAGNGSWTKPLFFYVEDKGQSSTAMRAEVIAGIVVSVTIILLLFVALGVWFVAKKKFQQNGPNGILYASVNPEYISVGKLDAYVPDEWEFPREKIALLSEIGQGSFGMVYKGVAKEIIKGEKETKVAVKTVNEGASLRDRIEFLNEASVMKAFNCNHVVRLLGVVSQGQPTLVIMELMANGDLKNFLRLHRPDEEDYSGKEPLTLKQILQMAGEIADGMAYLSDKKYVHCDLAARNCMVSEFMVVKIGDFGMTRDIYERDYYRKGGKGLLPVRWMSPESLKDGVFTSQSDVWSYGVVLWEMATLAAQPYQGLSNEQVLKYVIDGDIMERPEGCPQKLYILMLKCWKHNPKHRPTFHEIVEMLIPDLDTSFTECSYFFSREEPYPAEAEEGEQGDDEVNVLTPLTRSPQHEPALSEEAKRDSVHSSDIDMTEQDSVSISANNPIPKEEFRLPHSISNHSSAEAGITSNEGSKGSSKSTSSGHGQNGLANGHLLPRQVPSMQV